MSCHSREPTALSAARRRGRRRDEIHNAHNEGNSQASIAGRRGRGSRPACPMSSSSRWVHSRRVFMPSCFPQAATYGFSVRLVRVRCVFPKRLQPTQRSHKQPCASAFGFAPVFPTARLGVATSDVRPGNPGQRFTRSKVAPFLSCTRNKATDAAPKPCPTPDIVAGPPLPLSPLAPSRRRKPTSAAAATPSSTSTLSAPDERTSPM